MRDRHRVVDIWNGHGILPLEQAEADLIFAYHPRRLPLMHDVKTEDGVVITKGDCQIAHIQTDVVDALKAHRHRLALLNEPRPGQRSADGEVAAIQSPGAVA